MRIARTTEPEAPFAPPGPYVVLRRLPADEFGRWSYHLACRSDGHERVVPERYLFAVRVAVPANDGQHAADAPGFPAWGAVHA